MNTSREQLTKQAQVVEPLDKIEHLVEPTEFEELTTRAVRKSPSRAAMRLFDPLAQHVADEGMDLNPPVEPSGTEVVLEDGSQAVVSKSLTEDISGFVA